MLVSREYHLSVLHDLVRPYLARLSAVSGRSQLHSADVHQLLIPQIGTTSMGLRGFQCAAPVAWNALPSLLHDPELSLTEFRQLLKNSYVSLMVNVRRHCTRFCDSFLLVVVFEMSILFYFTWHHVGCVVVCRRVNRLFPRYMTVPGSKGKLSASSVLYDDGW